MWTRSGLRIAGLGLGLALGLLIGAGPAQAILLEYEFAAGEAGIFATNGGLFQASSDLTGSILFDTDGPLAAGAEATVLDLALAGTATLCGGCEVLGLEIAHDPSNTSILDVVDDPGQPGTLALSGTLSMLWRLTGSFGTVDLAVTATTLAFGTRNDIDEDSIRTFYQIDSIVPLDDLPAGLDLSALERLKMTGPGEIVPEPTSLALVAASILGVGAWRRRRGS